MTTNSLRRRDLFLFKLHHLMKGSQRQELKKSPGGRTIAEAMEQHIFLTILHHLLSLIFKFNP